MCESWEHESLEYLGFEFPICDSDYRVCFKQILCHVLGRKHNQCEHFVVEMGVGI